MSSLTENTIKQVTLSFLKNYYRRRQRDISSTAATLTGTDMRGEGGVVADGFLSFYLEKERRFTATFEATSHDTRQEVRYSIFTTLLWWDAAALALLTAAVVLLFLHEREFYIFLRYGYLGSGLYLLGAGGAFFYLYTLLLRRFRRYRIIYAIEQFKQYFADEQWIAIGYDVFARKEGRYYRELEQQCIRYGLGLIEIDARRRPNLIMAPSRAQNYDEARRRIQLLPIPEFRKRLSQLPGRRYVERIREQMTTLLGENYRQLAANWQRRPYYKQLSLSILGLVLCGLIFHRQWLKMPVRYVNEPMYAARLARQAADARPEPEYYIVDAPQAPFGDTTFEPYVLPQDENRFGNLVETDLFNPADTLPTTASRIIIAQAGQEPVAYLDCSRFYAYDTTFFIIQDTFLPNENLARRRLQGYNAAGLDAAAVWSACFQGLDVGYILYLDNIFVDSLAATAMRDSLARRLDRPRSRLSVKPVRPFE